MELVRVFLAIKPDLKTKEEIRNYQAHFLNNKAFRLIKENDIHLTIIFIGEVYKNLVLKIIEICKNTSLNHSVFTINLDLFDYGPDIKRPRLVWLKGETPKQLLDLKKDLEESLIRNRIPFELEKREFQTHITIARINKGYILPKRENIIQKTQLQFNVDSFYLMESHLSPSGATYKEIEKFFLKT